VFISEPDGGIYDALNKGIAKASGDVIGFLHSDDLFASEDVLSNVANAFSGPDVDGVYGDLVYVRKGTSSSIVRYWRAGNFSLSRLGWGWMPPHPDFLCAPFGL
jgi:glycosyltransferase